MCFRTESAKTYHPKHPREGTTFWSNGISLHAFLNIDIDITIADIYITVVLYAYETTVISICTFIL